MLLLQKFKISGHSMEPAIKNGEKILATPLFYLFKSPKINDIVVFKFRGKVFVKRIILFKDNKYFVEGDNKKDSIDSKDFGLLSRNQILGKVIIKL